MNNSRATCRAGHRCEPVNHRQAWHCQVMHSKLTCDEIAATEGISGTTPAAMVNPDRDDTWPPSRPLASILDRTADNDAVPSFHAVRVGGLFFRPPSIADSADFVARRDDQTVLVVWHFDGPH